MSKEQTALDAIRFEVAKEKGFISGWVELELKGSKNQLDECWKKVAIRYARECCQATISDYKEKLKAEISKMMTLNGITRHPFKVEAAEILKLIDSIKA